MNRIIDCFIYNPKKQLEYDCLDIYFRLDPELFDQKFLDKIGNPKKYEAEQ
jgi:hypothetical protein